MGTWKIKWLLKYCLKKEVFRSNRRVLKNPFIFYYALIFKFFPFVHPKPIKFYLREGGYFSIPDLMSCYIYWELFNYDVYGLEQYSGSIDTVLDIGANIGLASIRLKMLFPSAEIISFEPYKTNYLLLKNNLLNCNFNDILTFELGIFAEKGLTKLYPHLKNSGGHSLFKEDLSGDPIDINIITLQDAINLTSSGKCDLLKLDCEGAEYEIIMSMTPDLAPKIKTIIYEATAERYDPEALNAHLELIGYKVTFVKGYVYRATYSK